MAEEKKALSCPFCGGKSHHMLGARQIRMLDVVGCLDCFAEIQGTYEPESALSKWNTRAQLPSQGGEAVEVVASIAVDAEGVVQDFTLEPGLDRHPGGYTVTPLMTVAQHQRILLSTVIRCEQKGAFKTCLECGYQDGHDLICQYHESKRAAVSNDLTNVRCLCCQSEHAHNSYDAGFIAGSGMCQVCDAALPARRAPEGKEFSQFLSAVMDAAGLVRHGRQSKELSEYLGSKCMEYMLSATPAQPDQCAHDLTMVKVSRELLEQIAVELEHDNDRYFLGRELRALLEQKP